MSVPSDPPNQKDQQDQLTGPGEPETGTAGQQPWLHRLTAEQWLGAAENELRGAQNALLVKQQRTGVTYARRAAGMALNACLCLAPNEAYGRSYMEHLQALQKDAAVEKEVREAARQLLAVPLTQQLLTLGSKGDTKAAEFAGRILAYAQAFVARSRATDGPCGSPTG